MTKEEAIWWVNHLFEIRKEEYFNKGMIEDAKEVEEAQHMAIEALKDRPQSKWIKTDGGDGWNEWYVFKCPLCGATIEDKQYRSWEYNFCPNCGAKMKGGDNK